MKLSPGDIKHLLNADKRYEDADRDALTIVKAIIKPSMRVYWMHGDHVRSGVVQEKPTGFQYDNARILIISDAGVSYRLDVAKVISYLKVIKE